MSASQIEQLAGHTSIEDRVDPECIINAEELLEEDLIAPDIIHAAQDVDEEEMFRESTELENDGLDTYCTQITHVVQSSMLTTEEHDLSEKARKHFNRLMARCTDNQCKLLHLEKLASSLACRALSERIEIVRSVLLAAASHPGEVNDLVEALEDAVRQRKKPQRDLEENSSFPRERSSVVYAIRGKRLCRPAFAAVMQVSERTVEEHLRIVASVDRFSALVNRKNERRQDKKGVQRTALNSFLFHYGDEYGLESPVGRHNNKEKVCQILPIGSTTASVYEHYKCAWSDICATVIQNRPRVIAPKAPLSLDAFRNYWKEDCANVRIPKGGSDFCDLCISLKEDLARLPHYDPRYNATVDIFNTHRSRAREEFSNYKTVQKQWRQLPMQKHNFESRHFVFDFAEKVLLPRLLKQPGQLHFVTGLKFDLNGVSSSRSGINYIFGLPEGHWPNDKTANSVCSMLYHCLELPKESEGRGGVLYLTADNCAGQNKNRFMLWFCSWLVITGRQSKVLLHFLVCGHTKNVCDGSFGHVKRRLRRTDVWNPADMMRVIRDSSKATNCVPSMRVVWRDWKQMLGLYFTIPQKFKISRYHEFVFHSGSSNIGKVRVREFSTSTEIETYNLLKRNLSEDPLQMDWEVSLFDSALRVPIPDLSKVPSKVKSTRRRYLEHHVLDQYYTNNAEMRRAYFEDGSHALEVGSAPNVA